MNAKFKQAFLSFSLFSLIFMWVGVVSASPFLMLPDMHSDEMHCLFTAPGELACPMNLVEQIDQWSDSVAALPFMAITLFAFWTATGSILLTLLLRRVTVQGSPPGVSWLERKKEHWALSQGILNPKLFSMLQV
ncbi:MAG: hypothetical protein AAB558_03200 [Patescibacteria group bacterium]